MPDVHVSTLDALQSAVDDPGVRRIIIADGVYTVSRRINISLSSLRTGFTIEAATPGQVILFGGIPDGRIGFEGAFQSVQNALGTGEFMNDGQSIMSVAAEPNLHWMDNYSTAVSSNPYDALKVTLKGLVFTGGVQAPGTGGAAISFDGGFPITRTSNSQWDSAHPYLKLGSTTAHVVQMLNGFECNRKVLQCSFPGAELELISCNFTRNYGNTIGGSGIGIDSDCVRNPRYDHYGVDTTCDPSGDASRLGRMYGGRLTMTDCAITNTIITPEPGSNPRGYGGSAIYADGAAAVTLRNVIFENNIAAQGMQVSMYSNYAFDPRSLKGGAIAIFEGDDARLCDGSGTLVTIEKCVFRDSNTYAGGADVHLSKPAPQSRLVQNTFWKPSGGHDSGISISSACAINFECELGKYMLASPFNIPTQDMSGCLFECPAGTYGADITLTSAACSGSCPSGRYCPQKTVTPIAWDAPPCGCGRQQPWFLLAVRSRKFQRQCRLVGHVM